MADLELTYREVAQLVLLASTVDPDPQKTDPTLMAIHYKAKAAVTRDGGHLVFAGTLRIRKGA